MIDIRLERLLTLAQAAKLIPGRQGKALAVSTIHRWALDGVCGVQLETVLVGGRKMTSVEALQRFVEARTELAASRPGEVAKAPGSRREAACELDRSETQRVLRRAGIHRPDNRG